MRAQRPAHREKTRERCVDATATRPRRARDDGDARARRRRWDRSPDALADAGRRPRGARDARDGARDRADARDAIRERRATRARGPDDARTRTGESGETRGIARRREDADDADESEGSTSDAR